MRSPGAAFYRFIGIVDNDKKLDRQCGGFFGTFNPVQQQHHLFVRHHPANEQIVIILDKAIETFLLWNAEQVGISIEKYGFSLTLKELGNQFKTPTIETDPNYIHLLTDLYTRQAPGIITLKNLLNDFVLSH